MIALTPKTAHMVVCSLAFVSSAFAFVSSNLRTKAVLSSFSSLLLASINASLLRIVSKVESCLGTVCEEEVDTAPDPLEGFDGGIDEDPGERRQQQIQAGSRSHTWFRFSPLVVLVLLLDQRM